MFAGYSQTPRGYQYSTVDPENKYSRADPQLAEEENHSTFEEIFKNNWQFEKSLPFIAEINHKKTLKYTSYEQIFNEINEIQPFLSNFNSSNPLGIYSSLNRTTFVLYLACLYCNTPVLASGPGYQTEEEFMKTAEEVNCAAIIVPQSEISKVLATFNKNDIPVFSDINSLQAFKYKEGGDYRYIFGHNPTVKLTQEQLCAALPTWAKRLSISRDSRIALELPLGSNLLRLAATVAISQRAVIFFGNEYNQAYITHFFASEQFFIDTTNQITEKLNSFGFLFKLKYYPLYWWKNVKMALASTSSIADNRVFNRLKVDFGSEIRFFFTDQQPSYELHDLFTTVMTKPLVTVTVPEQWGNYGLCLPTDIRFTKYGTLGGPVACKITIDRENDTISCSASGNVLKSKANWDEEGSLYAITLKNLYLSAE
ncbi:hypothetical protein TVAG_433840 [Trichomonas vaginalis G3]|uniref:AMP-dependent synthetase/ligase domain-containing protein n=1 Tax=Trichomonas vaginalis (strain ATCC PRA-98 / G3) TaxID=412133 RepID=A2F7S9_TRIV3|nr:hypothetical protein TVAGG3_0247950 [Trichomonas vaginalis G3]EAX99056.1 hypothetical protein TVAG_433840 [Trichomonas vaginalis G3]KAI5553786.1 hypothetical protein TVAGG3_0247950 [Trichomonas vaginalis G3]|eukprot:XP_001311986.1 hypothetical protein [Trichomonas vaginalis G3]